MRITAIKAQVKNPERVSVYVEGAYAFSFNHAQLLDQKIHVGLEIDEARLGELKKASDFGKAYERALLYVMLRPRSLREMRDYCRRKKWPAEDCEAVVQKLVARGYLDDTAFARAWVESRGLLRAMSARRLRTELQAKGVAPDIISSVLAKLVPSDTAALTRLIAKKRRLARYQDDQKLMQYLARQGFSFDDIRAALGEGE